MQDDQHIQIFVGVLAEELVSVKINSLKVAIPLYSSSSQMNCVRSYTAGSKALAE